MFNYVGLDQFLIISAFIYIMVFALETEHTGCFPLLGFYDMSL